MSKPKKRQQLQRFTRNEGVALDVVRAGSAPHGVTIGIDLSKAPVPDRRYVADVAAVLEANGIVRLLFGQTRVDGRTLRSLLDVHFSLRGISQFLGSLIDIQATLDSLAAQGYVPRLLDGIGDEPQDTSYGLSANIIAVALSEKEACLDLYYVSSFVLARALQGTSLSADPVVRVTLPTEVLMGIISKLREIGGHLADEKRLGVVK